MNFFPTLVKVCMKKKKKRGSILALANQKGGVGKSVSSTNLACAFASQGYKVLLVDADYQGNASSQIGIKDQAEDLEKTITSGLLAENEADTIWLKTKFENVYAIAADQEFCEFNIANLGQPGSHGLLKDWLELAREKFDIVVIDTHPSLDLTFQNVMVASDYYILPLFAEAESLEGLHVMFKHVKKIKDKLNPTLHILGCFVTKFDKSIKTHKRFVETIELFGKQIGMPLLGIIPFSKAFASASETKVPVVVSSPKLPVGAAYLKLAKILIPELRPARRGRSPSTPEVQKSDVKAYMKKVNESEYTPLVTEEGPCI